MKTSDSAKAGVNGPGDRKQLESVKAVAHDVRGITCPIYRKPISHNTIAELAEGYRILSSGQKTVSIAKKDMFALMQNVGLHMTEEEFAEVMRVIGQGDNQNADEFNFTDFLLLMTCEVNDTMAEELRSAFLNYDKQKTGFVTRKQFTEMFATLGERSSPEELEELLSIAEQDDTEQKIDYNKFVNELIIRLNCM
ncbi:EF-hand protein 5 [Trypanosoma theileri]|uniref:EF-hand protein 5 n=1 Tax=Trypanosoma theileri TaxID=67003 RepID=A0A1X0NN63_9TRYP|nr:EF-hand protein 5 [Trypanosoma theileri]ORC85928.1 EF-hand protein 5 [Trypanosoma theileri]